MPHPRIDMKWLMLALMLLADSGSALAQEQPRARDPEICELRVKATKARSDVYNRLTRKFAEFSTRFSKEIDDLKEPSTRRNREVLADLRRRDEISRRWFDKMDELAIDISRAEAEYAEAQISQRMACQS